MDCIQRILKLLWNGVIDGKQLQSRRMKNQNKESFTPTFEEQGCRYLEGDNPKNPGLYSLSTAEKPKDIKRFVKFNSEYQKPYKIAIGKTDTSCGLVQRTREREKNRKDSHVDWWLYEKSEPYKFFEMIDDFESYYEEFKKR